MARAMKDSGIEWIGDIPEGWNCNRIDAVYSERNTKVSDKDFDALSVTKQGILLQLESAAKTDNGDNRKLVMIGDFVINSRSDRRGSCGISDYDGSVSLISIVLMPKSNVHNKYFNFAFRTERFADEYFRWGNGIVNDLWATKWSGLKRINICIPTLPEQQAIADFLDIKCNLIDSTIKKQKAVIEKLKHYKQSLITEAVTKGLDPTAKMKLSGIEWIGDIPEGWAVSTIKNNFKVINGSTPSSDNKKYWDGNIVWITPAEMDENIVQIYNSRRNITDEGLQSCGTTLVPAKSIIVSNRAPIGQVCIAGVELCTNQGCKCLSSKIENHEKFFYYFLITQTSTLNMLGRGTTFLELSTYNLANFKIPLPSIGEQQAIADYLDTKCTGIESAINSKQKLIEKLTEYKKSLIFECVTGKRECDIIGDQL